MDLQRLYLSMPMRLQEVGLSLYAMRLDQLYYGRDFSTWAERFANQEQWTAAQYAQHQLHELRLLLHTAMRQVPWFRRLAAQQGLRAEDFTALAHLRRLPIMEKDPIRQDPWAFVRADYPPSKLWLEKTSGTTGKSLRIYWSREMLLRWWAMHEVRVRRWAGVSQQMPRAMVGGRAVIPGDTHQPPFWRYNRHWQQLYMSSYHISPSTAPAYLDALARYQCQWITGYGSAIALLGEYLCAHPSRHQVQAVITSGDTVTARQRQSIEDGFQCRMYDNYGSSEGCCVISECEQGRLHVQPEVGILEIVDAWGAPCPPGGDGEFICTGLLNDVMPLIRYRTGDYGCWATEQGCACGRQSPIVAHITGRTDDYLQLADGRRIGRLSTAMKKAPSVKQAQIVQDTATHAWLLVVPEPCYRTGDGQTLVEDILSRIGEAAIRLDVCPVAEIPPTPVGKHVLVRRIMQDRALQEQYQAVIARGVEREVAA